MKRHLIICISLGLHCVSCEKHEALNKEASMLDATLFDEQARITQLDKHIVELGGREAGEQLRLQLEMLRSRTTGIEKQNDIRAKKWAEIEAEFVKLKPAAEAFKSSHSQ